MEGQGEHRGGIVSIEPGALALAPAQGEEIAEDLLVRDDAGEDRDQHHHRSDADQPARPDDRQIIEIEVEAVEELASAGVARVRRDAVGTDQRLIVASTASPAAAAAKLAADILAPRAAAAKTANDAVAPLKANLDRATAELNVAKAEVEKAKAAANPPKKG